MTKNEYFLPYQMRWLNDNSKIKIWEKSRRIGATYVQSFEDVQDCINKRVPYITNSSTKFKKASWIGVTIKLRFSLLCPRG